MPVARYFSEGDTLYIMPAGITPYFFRRYIWRDLLDKVDAETARHGHFASCNGRPPLLYFPGHTRIDVYGLMSQGKGCVGCWEVGYCAVKKILPSTGGLNTFTL